MCVKTLVPYIADSKHEINSVFLPSHFSLPILFCSKQLVSLFSSFFYEKDTREFSHKEIRIICLAQIGANNARSKPWESTESIRAWGTDHQSQGHHGPGALPAREDLSTTQAGTSQPRGSLEYFCICSLGNIYWRSTTGLSPQESLLMGKKINAKIHRACRMDGAGFSSSLSLFSFLELLLGRIPKTA